MVSLAFAPTGAQMMNLYDLNLPKSAVQALQRKGLKTLQDVTTKSSQEITMLPGLSQKSLRLLTAALADHQLNFRD